MGFRGQRKRPWAGGAAVFLAFLILQPGSLYAQMPTTAEDSARAWYLANFSRFVEWPEKAFPSPDAPFVIGVVGEFSFGPSLGVAVTGRTAHGRKIEIRWKPGKAPPEDLRGCQILFLSHLDHKRVAQILGALRGASILIVGETEGFLEAGGIINFVLENDRVRFEINPDAAVRAELKLSSQLLASARNIVGGPKAPKS
jgi:hypothetical protein